MEGSHITHKDIGIAFRDYLNGISIHHGNRLLLKVDEQWIYVRYEVADFRKREIVLIGADCNWKLNRETMLFRWPER
jgi:hypothetical protein